MLLLLLRRFSFSWHSPCPSNLGTEHKQMGRYSIIWCMIAEHCIHLRDTVTFLPSASEAILSPFLSFVCTSADCASRSGTKPSFAHILASHGPTDATHLVGFGLMVTLASIRDRFTCHLSIQPCNQPLSVMVLRAPLRLLLIGCLELM
ncbi:hypothetical protein BT96DRAFT_290970 [Gymnopus androsaceus JB14]|uniref:Uncharacterized protein n=1 Tax=Gymnopus androsaceus JB14 TaxID=1447944 RepID=A0A6A4H0Y5_9AGAR|nr:hypothetical protein BT96DRAFT_290970 [Gymnopus androsaceus JB14]